jgi:hypothetical protein
VKLLLCVRRVLLVAYIVYANVIAAEVSATGDVADSLKCDAHLCTAANAQHCKHAKAFNMYRF